MNEPFVVPTCPLCKAPLPYVGAPHRAYATSTCPHIAGSIPSDPVEWNVYMDYMYYPTLHGRSPWTRWWSFRHMFLGTGTGYRWHNGQLIDVVESDHPPVGAFVPTRDLEEEYNIKITDERLLNDPRYAPFVQEQEERSRQYMREDQAKLNQKPQTWGWISNSAPIFEVPPDVEKNWLYAACDACQMFFYGSAEGQHMSTIVQLYEVRTVWWAMLGIQAPAIEDKRMAWEIVHADKSVQDAILAEDQ